MVLGYTPNSAVGIDKTCPVCKKMFLVRDAKKHAYRIWKQNHLEYACSWSCVRAWENKHPTKEDKQRIAIRRQLEGIIE